MLVAGTSLRLSTHSVERRLHRFLPHASHALPPDFVHSPQVGTEFTAVLEFAPSIPVTKQNVLDHIRYRTAYQLEVDPIRRGETDRLQRHDDQTMRAGVMGSENHILSTLKHSKLFLQTSRCPTEMRRRDDLKDQLAGRINGHGYWTAWTSAAAQAKVNGKSPAGYQCIPTKRSASQAGE